MANNNITNIIVESTGFDAAIITKTTLVNTTSEYQQGHSIIVLQMEVPA